MDHMTEVWVVYPLNPDGFDPGSHLRFGVSGLLNMKSFFIFLIKYFKYLIYSPDVEQLQSLPARGLQFRLIDSPVKLMEATVVGLKMWNLPDVSGSNEGKIYDRSRISQPSIRLHVPARTIMFS